MSMNQIFNVVVIPLRAICKAYTYAICLVVRVITINEFGLKILNKSNVVSYAASCSNNAQGELAGGVLAWDYSTYNDISRVNIRTKLDYLC